MGLILEENSYWFRERNQTYFPGQDFGLEVESILYQQKSKYQDILLFKSKSYGHVLVLDDCTQFTERDEFVYHEMVAFLPLLVHPHPKNVLIIGGGDGGVVREVIKHPQVERVSLCEIDEKVIEVCQKYLPKMTESLNDRRVRVLTQDGIDFLKKHQDEFDVIITDCSDPQGPAEALFERNYYSLMKKALKSPNGIICCQGECIWLDLDLIKKISSYAREEFPVVGYANCSIPSYPSGALGFLLASMDSNAQLKEPIDSSLIDKLQCRYYNKEIHRASFVLPEFAKKQLEL